MKSINTKQPFVTNLHKQMLCEKHKKVLDIIWGLGKGVMFKTHVEEYCNVFDKTNRIDVGKWLRELADGMIVELTKIGNVVIVKLRKFALRYLQKKAREEISSLKFTATKIMKSAFVNSIILKHIKDELFKANPTFERVREHYSKASTFLASEKQGYNCLNHYIDNYFEQGKAVREEVQKLKKIEEEIQECLQKKERRVTTSSEYSYNMNSMQSSNVYIDYAKSKTGYMHIAILDINGMSPTRLAEKMSDTFYYLCSFLAADTNKNFKFVIYTLNQERKAYFESEQNEIRKKLELRKLWGEIEYEIIDLEIEKRLFNGQKMLIH